MKVSEIMRYEHNLIKVSPATTLEFIIYRYDNVSVDSRLTYVVDETNALLGVVTIFDILRRIVSDEIIEEFKSNGRRREDLSEALRKSVNKNKALSARDIMRTEFFSVRPDDLFVSATKLLIEKAVTAVPVVSAEGVLVGEITRRIILRYLAHTF
jgi:CBS domain-containing protein